MAEIVKGSYVERDWLRRRMLGGIFGGVYFHKAFNQFVSDPLNEDQMTNIQDHPAVKISVMSAADPETTLWGRGDAAPSQSVEHKEEIKNQETPDLEKEIRKSGRPKTINAQKNQNI